MTFAEALAQMKAGKCVTRRRYGGNIKFSVGIGMDDGEKHQPPWQNYRYLKHVKVSSDRWRVYIVSSITVHDIFAEDWEVVE